MSLFGLKEKRILESHQKVLGRDKRISAQFEDVERIRILTKQRDFLIFVVIILTIILIKIY